MELFRVIEKLKAHKILEVIAETGRPLLGLKGYEWKELNHAEINSEVLLKSALEIITSDQKRNLSETGALEWESEKLGQKAELSLIRQKVGHSLSIRPFYDFSNVQNFWNLPQFLKSVGASQGNIRVIFGSRKSGRTEMARHLLSQFQMPKRLKGGFGFSSRETDDFQNLENFDQWKAVQANLKVMVIDQKLSERLIEFACRQAMQGTLIYLVVEASNPMEVIFELERVAPAFKQIWNQRLDLLIEVQLLPGLEHPYHFISHVHKNWKDLSKIDQDRLANQSLLQAIVQRQVDLKTGFHYSKNPQGLDQLLKDKGF